MRISPALAPLVYDERDKVFMPTCNNLPWDFTCFLHFPLGFFTKKSKYVSSYVMDSTKYILCCILEATCNIFDQST